MMRWLTIAALPILGVACDRSGTPTAPASKQLGDANISAPPTGNAAITSGFDEALLAAAPPGAIAGQVVDRAQHPAAGVIVYVQDPSKAHYPPPAQPTVIDQHDKAFAPRVLAVLAGTKVAFKNSDMVLHNVYSRSHTKTFDLGAYSHDESRSALFEEPGRVDVFCAIHTNMHAVILVLDNPYFATTDARGYFEIHGLSIGPHTLRVWSEQNDEQEIHAELAGDRPSVVRHKLP